MLLLNFVRAFIAFLGLSLVYVLHLIGLSGFLLLTLAAFVLFIVLFTADVAEAKLVAFFNPSDL